MKKVILTTGASCHWGQGQRAITPANLNNSPIVIHSSAFAKLKNIFVQCAFLPKILPEAKTEKGKNIEEEKFIKVEKEGEVAKIK